MTYTVTCPACDEEFDIDAEPVELAEEEGCYADCPECKEKQIEFDYDLDTGALTATPGQYESDEDPEADDDEEDDELIGEEEDDAENE